jgi:hypothetical protein
LREANFVEIAPLTHQGIVPLLPLDFEATRQDDRQFYISAADIGLDRTRGEDNFALNPKRARGMF